ncbi:GAF domain-containing sensor histidine kinase [Sphingomonas sp. BIUV-7]|uniref:histidine kinase n=1 Tax=Sphingomonas natans TaxID=3063330 RepID=A0ABT8YB63_9SPHN|nr:GAF domain-containing sensor histidine kinase [Sphingomonas sp. BIUV-7]MDO6415579.1 GAF domain-containing sensor histidine kinase [Sphingomonas sp. BIUV-7]
MLTENYQRDVEAVGRIGVVPTILETCCRVTGMGFAAVARVSDERWVACSVLDKIGFGLSVGDELKLETTICHEIRQTAKAVIIPDVGNDPAYRDHHTPAIYGFKSYISVPIHLPSGDLFGTLCAIDPAPADLDRPEIAAMFAMFADLLGFHLNASDKLQRSEDNLADERAAGELREQFLAVVGHDLRNPLAALQAGVTLLVKNPAAERRALILDQMQTSIARMTGLINDVLDFARGRLGAGFALDRRRVSIADLQEQVVGELAASHLDQVIVSECAIEALVDCDPQRLGQLLSNLIGNALTHGAADEPVIVRSDAVDGLLVISVSNKGPEIPLADRPQLFQPFARGKSGAHREGLGLGLYIASQIAIAHGGALTVASSAEETSFTFRMPLA